MELATLSRRAEASLPSGSVNFLGNNRIRRALIALEKVMGVFFMDSQLAFIPGIILPT